jgi:UDP-N-acetyl-D-galactosamine dehydrogenase
MTQRRLHVVDSDVLVMGLTFKENCPDLRNTKVIDVIRELETYHARVHVYDPWVDDEEAEQEYGIKTVDTLEPGKYGAIILAVAHDDFLEMGVEEIRALGKENSVLYDIKSVFPPRSTDGRL